MQIVINLQSISQLSDQSQSLVDKFGAIRPKTGRKVQIREKIVVPRIAI